MVGRAAVGELPESTVPVDTVAAFKVNHVIVADLSGDKPSLIPVLALAVADAVAHSPPIGIGMEIVDECGQAVGGQRRIV